MLLLKRKQSKLYLLWLVYGESYCNLSFDKTRALKSLDLSSSWHLARIICLDVTLYPLYLIYSNNTGDLKENCFINTPKTWIFEAWTIPEWRSILLKRMLVYLFGSTFDYDVTGQISSSFFVIYQSDENVFQIYLHRLSRNFHYYDSNVRFQSK